MLEKKTTYLSSFTGYYMIIYHTDAVSPWIDKLMDSDLRFDTVDLTDDSDVGLKLYNGEISYEKFLMLYPDVLQYVDSVIFNVINRPDVIAVSFDRNEESITLCTTNKDLEFEQLIGSPSC